MAARSVLVCCWGPCYKTVWDEKDVGLNELLHVVKPKGRWTVSAMHGNDTLRHGCDASCCKWDWSEQWLAFPTSSQLSVTGTVWEVSTLMHALIHARHIGSLSRSCELWFMDIHFLPCDCMQCNARYCCRSLSVRLSRVWIVTKLNDALQIFLIPHERATTLLLWHQQWLVGDATFRLKFALKVTHPFRNAPTSTDFHL